jgi:hypothetical protein
MDLIEEYKIQKKRNANQNDEYLLYVLAFFKDYFLSLGPMGVSTVETNQDRDRDFSICRDQLLKLVEIILTVETRIFFVSVKIFKIETFESRLGQVEIFIEIC